MDEIDLKLNVTDVNFLLQVLGELPSKTGAWVLIQKIQAQAKNQPPKPADAGA